MLDKAKILKRVLIGFLCAVLAIFLVLLTAPLLFKNQLMELAKTELNKILLAKVDFKDLKLSFIRNFPDAYIALEGLEVTGINNFEDELLAAFDRFSVTVNIMSVIKMDNIEVKSVLLDRARLNGHVLKDGSANWNIVKPAEKKEETAETEKKETEPFAFSVGLKKLEIRSMSAAFRDEKNKMTAEIENLNYTLRGDMKQENVDLNMELAVDGINLWIGAVRFANNASAGFISEVAADLKNMNFILKDNRFNLNDIVLKFSGSAGMQSGGINADITFASEKTDFKSLLSLVPAVYMNSFQDVRTTGSLTLNGGIKGTYSENTMPNANLNLTVDNAAFSYPDLPKSINSINIAAKVLYDGEDFDRTTVDVSRLNFVMAGNPFNAQFSVKTPESDMQVAARLAGKIDFDSISDIIPLEDITLNGLLECDLSIAGKLSMLENERYEDFQAEGHLKLNNFDFESPSLPQRVKIAGTQLDFTPRWVRLVNLDAVIGNTDIEMSGTLENFIPFVLRNDTVSGTLALNSNTIDLNEFMSGKPARQITETEEETAEEVPADSSKLSVIEVPKNIDFAMVVDIGKIFFDNLVITDTTGRLSVKDGKITMQNLAMNLLEGSLTLNGEYNTQDMDIPFVDFDIDIKLFDIPSALSSFSMLEKIFPEAQNYAGKVSAAMTLNSVLDQQMSPVLEKVDSKGRLQTQNLELRNSKIFGAMADFLKNENWRTPAPNNVNIDFKIIDGRVHIVNPIEMNLPNAKLELLGDIGLDMTLNYKLNTIVPVSIIGSGATTLMSNVPGLSGLKEITVAGLIRGTAADPSINLSASDMIGSVTAAVRDQVTENITHRVEEVRSQVTEQVNQQMEQIMAEAQRQADSIRSTAKQTADKLRSEANAQADKLISDAARKNIIERGLAQAAAELLRKEGEDSAKKLEQESENQIKSIMDAAQLRADALKGN